MLNYFPGTSKAPRANSPVNFASTFAKLMEAHPALQDLLVHLLEYEAQRARHSGRPFKLRAVARQFLEAAGERWGKDYSSALGNVRTAERYIQRFIENQWDDHARPTTSRSQTRRNVASPQCLFPSGTPVETGGVVVVEGPSGAVRVPFDSMKVRLTLCPYTGRVTHCEVLVSVQWPSQAQKRELIRLKKAMRVAPIGQLQAQAPARRREV